MVSLQVRIAKVKRAVESLARAGRIRPVDAEFANVLGLAFTAHPEETRILQRAVAAFADAHPDLSTKEMVVHPEFTATVAPLFDRLVEVDERLGQFLAHRAARSGSPGV